MEVILGKTNLRLRYVTVFVTQHSSMAVVKIK